MMKMIILSIVIAITLIISTTYSDPVQWRTADGGNGHWYEIKDPGVGALSWETANALAQSSTYLGITGNLASITSSEENNFFIKNVLNNDQHHSVWIGAFRNGVGGDWQWSSGESWGYTFWDPDEPQNNNIVNACIAAFSNIAMQEPSGADVLGGWNDIIQTVDHPNYGYIVEYVPVPSAFILSIIGLALAGRVRKI